VNADFLWIYFLGIWPFAKVFYAKNNLFLIRESFSAKFFPKIFFVNISRLIRQTIMCSFFGLMGGQTNRVLDIAIISQTSLFVTAEIFC